jgi:NDP-sugar pyrophosphorylase family protein
MIAANARATASGIVLAGTYPWSHPAFDSLMPRAMLPIANRPLISYALSWLRDAGVRDIAVCGNRDTRPLGPVLAKHGFDGVAPSYYEDPMPRGAAGSIRDAALAMKADTFVVAEGTSVPSVCLAELLASHHDSGAVATVVVHSESQNPARAGMHVPTGIYVFERRAFDFVPAKGFSDIKENLIPDLYRAGERVLPHHVSGASARVLSPSTYLAVNGWIVECLVSGIEPISGYVRSGNCLFHNEASIATDAVFVGPVLVGPGARVHAGAVIVGPTSIGREAIIRRGAVVTGSAIWRRCVVNEDAMADRAILADGTTVERGSRAYRTVMARQPNSVQGANLAGRPSWRHWPASSVWRRFGRALTHADLSESTAPP